MIAHGTRPTTAAARRTIAAALTTLFVWLAAAPALEALHAHADDRCCRNGVCCCRPKVDPPGPCLRSVCRCAGHDADPAGAPPPPRFPPTASFELTVDRQVTPVAALAGPSAADGFGRPPFHPPRAADCGSC